MLPADINVGDFVRNNLTGNFGLVVCHHKILSASSPYPFLKVLLVKGSMKQHSLWRRRNVSLIPDAKQ